MSIHYYTIYTTHSIHYTLCTIHHTLYNTSCIIKGDHLNVVHLIELCECGSYFYLFSN